MSDISNSSSKRILLAPFLTVGDPEVLASIIITPVSTTPAITHRAHLQHLILTPNLRNKSAICAASADTEVNSLEGDALSGISMASVQVYRAELRDCSDDTGVLLQAAIAVVPHGSEVWAGGGGRGEGEEGDEA
ncbi:hypothetical protein KCU78_g16282, partial [Aureobasidium melanogenum]